VFHFFNILTYKEGWVMSKGSATMVKGKLAVGLGGGDPGLGVPQPRLGPG